MDSTEGVDGEKLRIAAKPLSLVFFLVFAALGVSFIAISLTEYGGFRFLQSPVLLGNVLALCLFSRFSIWALHHSGGQREIQGLGGIYGPAGH